jgi:hypothetical protein
MNAPLAPPRTISNIKVTPFDASTSGQALRIEWQDNVGADCCATRFGRSAEHLITDLHAATLIGKGARQCFLIGWIRGLSDGGGLDD